MSKKEMQDYMPIGSLAVRRMSKDNSLLSVDFIYEHLIFKNERGWEKRKVRAIRIEFCKPAPHALGDPPRFEPLNSPTIKHDEVFFDWYLGNNRKSPWSVYFQDNYIEIIKAKK